MSEVRVADEGQVHGVGPGVLEPQHDGTDVGGREVDRRVEVHRLETRGRRGVLLHGQGRRPRRRRHAVGHRSDLGGAELLRQVGAIVVGQTGDRGGVAERGDDVLVALGAVVGAVGATADQRHPGALQVAVGDERERRVVHHREHLAVLHQVLCHGEVGAARHVVEGRELDLAAVDAALGVLGVDPRLACLRRVLGARAGDAGPGPDEAQLHRILGDPPPGAGFVDLDRLGRFLGLGNRDTQRRAEHDQRDEPRCCRTNLHTAPPKGSEHLRPANQAPSRGARCRATCRIDLMRLGVRVHRRIGHHACPAQLLQLGQPVPRERDRRLAAHNAGGAVAMVTIGVGGRSAPGRSPPPPQPCRQ